VQKFAKLSIIPPGIVQFHSNFVQRLMYHNFQGQPVKGQGQRTSIKKRYNSSTDKLLKVKFGENYPKPERNT